MSIDSVSVPANVSASSGGRFRLIILWAILGVAAIVVLPMVFSTRYSTNLLVLWSGMAISTASIALWCWSYMRR